MREWPNDPNRAHPARGPAVPWPKVDADPAEPLAATVQRRVTAIFARMDQNKDGKLSKNEVPEGMWTRLQRIDANEDGSVTKAELAKTMRGPRPQPKKAGERTRRSRRRRNRPSRRRSPKEMTPMRKAPRTRTRTRTEWLQCTFEAGWCDS